ncbi:MAG: ATP-dependent endonuclease [Cyanobacteria bacterium RUI128]|nr:ATP-dependent endonuclease [Cyanobacteria bacterium RUI128]
MPNIQNIKFKKLTPQQIVISIDRLTRFKPTEEKYLRVFSDIITSNLIEPKIKKSALQDMNYEEIRDIAVKIFNNSVGSYPENTDINKKLEKYENSVFINSNETQLLLKNNLNYEGALSLAKDDLPLNLKWLKRIITSDDLTGIRKKEQLLYPIEQVVIAEGITEEILLPVFAQHCNYNFYENGVKVIAAGGKNQVVKLYYKLCEELRIPIFVLLDKDAESNEFSINTKLRKTDKVYLLDSGEFEDLLPKELIIKTINNEFKNFVSIKKSDLDLEMPMVKTLEELFKDKCLHEFKKAEFAQRVKTQIKSDKDISDELKEIIKTIASQQALV